MTLTFCLLSLNLIACANYQTKVDKVRHLMTERQFSLASSKLEPLAKKDGKDQLVYVFDYATALQLEGHYKKSTQFFLLADQLAEFKDYHSISKITASVLFNEGAVQYKGHNYEKVFINAMLAINFLSESNLEGALVETRRLNERLKYFEIEGEKPYEQNLFALYLSAMIWEADHKWDDAYIDYAKAFKLAPEIPMLKQDLIMASAHAQRWKEHKKWKQQFGIKNLPSHWKNRSYGELVLIYQQGWGPRKRPASNNHRLPYLYPVPSHTKAARMLITDGPTVLSERISSVEDIAIKVFNDGYGALVAKRIAAFAAKEVISRQVYQENKLLGALLNVGMHVSDQADLRQWSTLPETFQIAKVRLVAGKYKVQVEGLNSQGVPTGEMMVEKEFEVKAGGKTFFTWRSFR